MRPAPAPPPAPETGQAAVLAAAISATQGWLQRPRWHTRTSGTGRPGTGRQVGPRPGPSCLPPKCVSCTLAAQLCAKSVISLGLSLCKMGISQDLLWQRLGVRGEPPALSSVSGSRAPPPQADDALGRLAGLSKPGRGRQAEPPRCPWSLATVGAQPLCHPWCPASPELTLPQDTLRQVWCGAGEPEEVTLGWAFTGE